jgi:hAT family C-terminal dimerisation region
LDIYLAEARAPAYAGDSSLEYWRKNKARFPILARMARDYLAVQPTGKDIEGTFSKGRRTIPYYRKRQNGSTTRNQMLVNAGYDLGIYE